MEAIQKLVFPALEMVFPGFETATSIRQFQFIWCALVATSLSVDFPRQISYYKWFSNSGLELTQYRGYGQTASGLYGIIPAPKLSLIGMMMSGVGLICALLLACTSLVDPRLCMCVALVCFHCYASQLFCEVHMVAHNTCLMAPVMLLCMASSDIVERADNLSSQHVLAQQWPLFLLRFVLTTAYCSAACCKIRSCFVNKVNWLSGSTMQGCLFEAIMGMNKSMDDHFTFWLPTPFCRYIQRWLFTQPRLCGLMSMYGVLIELIAPLVLLFPNLNLHFAVAGLGLHYGIAYCQNIDFIHLWGPFYAVFFVGSEAAAADILGVAQAYWQLYPVAFCLGLLYAFIHIAGMVIHRYYPSLDILPLSRFPMFDAPKNLWDPAMNHWAWLTEKEHMPGTLMTYAFPMHGRKPYVMPEELDLLPFKYCIFGDYKAPGTSVDEVRQMTIYCNVVINDRLQTAMDRMFDEWHRGAKMNEDQDAIAKMLSIVDEARAAFKECPRRTAVPAILSWEAAVRKCLCSDTVDEKTEPLLKTHDTSGDLLAKYRTQTLSTDFGSTYDSPAGLTDAESTTSASACDSDA